MSAFWEHIKRWWYIHLIAIVVIILSFPYFFGIGPGILYIIILLLLPNIPKPKEKCIGVIRSINRLLLSIPEFNTKFINNHELGKYMKDTLQLNSIYKSKEFVKAFKKHCQSDIPYDMLHFDSPEGVRQKLGNCLAEDNLDPMIYLSYMFNLFKMNDDRKLFDITTLYESKNPDHWTTNINQYIDSSTVGKYPSKYNFVKIEEGYVEGGYDDEYGERPVTLKNGMRLLGIIFERGQDHQCVNECLLFNGKDYIYNDGDVYNMSVISLINDRDTILLLSNPGLSCTSAVQAGNRLMCAIPEFNKIKETHELGKYMDETISLPIKNIYVYTNFVNTFKKHCNDTEEFKKITKNSPNIKNIQENELGKCLNIDDVKVVTYIKYLFTLYQIVDDTYMLYDLTSREKDFNLKDVISILNISKLEHIICLTKHYHIYGFNDILEKISKGTTPLILGFKIISIIYRELSGLKDCKYKSLVYNGKDYIDDNGVVYNSDILTILKENDTVMLLSKK